MKAKLLCSVYVQKSKIFDQNFGIKREGERGIQ